VGMLARAGTWMGAMYAVTSHATQRECKALYRGFSRIDADLSALFQSVEATRFTVKVDRFLNPNHPGAASHSKEIQFL
jgi:hypothetical protein